MTKSPAQQLLEGGLPLMALAIVDLHSKAGAYTGETSRWLDRLKGSVGPNNPLPQVAEFERRVATWHAGDSGRPLYEFLGLTWEQYATMLSGALVEPAQVAGKGEGQWQSRFGGEDTSSKIAILTGERDEVKALTRERDELKSKLAGAEHAFVDCRDVLRKVESERDTLIRQMDELKDQLQASEYVLGIEKSHNFEWHERGAKMQAERDTLAARVRELEAEVHKASKDRDRMASIAGRRKAVIKAMRHELRSARQGDDPYFYELTNTIEACFGWANANEDDEEAGNYSARVKQVAENLTAANKRAAELEAELAAPNELSFEASALLAEANRLRGVAEGKLEGLGWQGMTGERLEAMGAVVEAWQAFPAFPQRAMLREDHRALYDALAALDSAAGETAAT